MSEIRYYRGKFKVEVMLKNKGNWKVKAIEKIDTIFTDRLGDSHKHIILPTMTFNANPKTLWRHPRKVVKRDLEVEGV